MHRGLRQSELVLRISCRSCMGYPFLSRSCSRWKASCLLLAVQWWTRLGRVIVNALHRLLKLELFHLLEGMCRRLLCLYIRRIMFGEQLRIHMIRKGPVEAVAEVMLVLLLQDVHQLLLDLMLEEASEFHLLSMALQVSSQLKGEFLTEVQLMQDSTSILPMVPI